MTKSVSTIVYKAQPTAGVDVSDLLIIATDTIPGVKSVSESFYRPALGGVFQSDAEKIVDALTASLPGGTLDRVLAVLLARKASLFVIAEPAKRRAGKKK